MLIIVLLNLVTVARLSVCRLHKLFTPNTYLLTNTMENYHESILNISSPPTSLPLVMEQYDTSVFPSVTFLQAKLKFMEKTTEENLISVRFTFLH